MAEQNFFNRVLNIFNPTYSQPFTPVQNTSHRIHIAPVQLARIRQDIQLWREAIQEAELAYYPFRVKMQRMFVDSILSGHTLACMQKRKDLTLLREWSFKNEANEENEELKKEFDTKWFTLFIEYALDAKFYGYSLIYLGDLIDNRFPNLELFRRWNVSPDRLNATSLVYSLSGVEFLNDEQYKDWYVWVDTVSEIGVSKCGYGLLYSVAQYEILARNILGNNADAAELYGMPTRVGTTSKTEGIERDTFEAALREMGSTGYILKDAMDEVELVESSTAGQGFKIYGELEKRLESKISKIILGHADALDSTPGKLGGADGEVSASALALIDKQTVDGTFIENVVNDILIPKLVKHGFKIDAGFKFCFLNNQEIVEKRINEDKANKETANIAYVMAQAGLEMDANYFSERTGIPTVKKEVAHVTVTPPQKFSNAIKNKLEKLYGK